MIGETAKMPGQWIMGLEREEVQQLKTKEWLIVVEFEKSSGIIRVK